LWASIFFPWSWRFAPHRNSPFPGKERGAWIGWMPETSAHGPMTISRSIKEAPGGPPTAPDVSCFTAAARGSYIHSHCARGGRGGGTVRHRPPRAQSEVKSNDPADWLCHHLCFAAAAFARGLVIANDGGCARISTRDERADIIQHGPVGQQSVVDGPAATPFPASAEGDRIRPSSCFSKRAIVRAAVSLACGFRCPCPERELSERI